MSVERYTKYIMDSFPADDPMAAWGKCVEFSEKMKQDFPELILVKGYVSSPENPDNNRYAGYDKQYTHQWLRTADGVIVDPTAAQFSLLGKLNYQEFEGVFTGWCQECGIIVYDGAVLCSKCVAEGCLEEDYV